jgi:AbrB family looped-hinge helix DNA binding protein
MWIIRNLRLPIKSRVKQYASRSGRIVIEEIAMALSKITRNHQVSIPKKIRDRLGLQEGDYVEVEERDGEIVMVPKKLIDADQAWFWTPDWQASEREADEDIKAGRISGPFKTMDELKKHLGA